jgi:hypothetical protein
VVICGDHIQLVGKRVSRAGPHDLEDLVAETVAAEGVEVSGVYSPGEPVQQAMKPFFTKLYDSCGVARQPWQDA